MQIPFKFVNQRGPKAIRPFFNYYSGKEYSLGYLFYNRFVPEWHLFFYHLLLLLTILTSKLCYNYLLNLIMNQVTML